MISVGPYIRDNVLPADLSVSEVARRLRVGRPALSNLLNGNATLSRDMALKLEREFGADADALIRRQADLEATAREAASRATPAGYLKITSTDIIHWADTIPSRTSLAVLLRRLAHTDTAATTRIDFPGNDAGERQGWDGHIDSPGGGHWVPQGVSGWELSTSADLPGKPGRDFTERAKLSESERERTIFVFVTARDWPEKGKWQAKQRALGVWRDVRAYDASDLEQWLEQSPTTQIWFMEQLGRTPDGVRSLDECWNAWANSTSPALSPILFEDALNSHGASLLAWLKDPGERPFVIAADSAPEAQAFLACALREPEAEDGRLYETTIVVDTAAALRKVAPAARGAVLVVADNETELAASGLVRQQRIIIIRPRTSVENTPDIMLETPSSATFGRALEAMGVNDDRLDQLKEESGLSPTILRRRLALSPALRKPPWANEADLVRKLVPMLLAGAWNRAVEADRILLGELSGKTADEIEVDLALLLAQPDSPVWAIGNHRGLVSRKDALFAAGAALTQQDIERFFEVAEIILSEDDPALDMPPGERWTANMHGKTREISSALRVAIGELLVLFAVYGSQVLGPHIRPVEVKVDALVSRLLRHVEARKWLSQRHDLPLLAEASPRAFLDAVESDLRSDDPQILVMLRPAGSGPFDSPDRSGLLWALETIAWKEDYYFRVGRILARLCEVPIDDNWVNKPENSLESLVRAWLPQAAVDVDRRIELLDILNREFPAVGWRVSKAQIDTGHGSASPNSRPRWRTDAAGAGGGMLTGQEVFRMRRHALDAMLDWPWLDGSQLGDMIELSADLPASDQARLWKRVETWIESGPSDEERASLRERMRRSVLSRQTRKKAKATKAEQQRRVIFDLLAPLDPIARHKWLFAEDWISEAGDDLLDDTFDFDAHGRHIDALRRTAISEIWASGGLDSIERLLAQCNAWHIVGRFLSEEMPASARRDLAIAQLDRIAESGSRPLTGCLQGFLFGISDDNDRAALLRGLAASLDDERAMILLKVSPFEESTWRLIEQVRPDLSNRYWNEVMPYGWRHDESALNMIVDRLLAANRPLAAFHAVAHQFKNLESATLVRLLRAITKPTEAEAETRRLDGHAIEKALEVLEARGEVSVAEMAQFEYLYISALTHSRYGIPNLEKQIAASPGDFVQLVSLLYKRDDGAEDEERRLAEGADRQAVGSNVYRTLDRLRRTPGTRDDGTIDPAALLAWLHEARAGFRAMGRAEVGDGQIGQLLGRTTSGADGIWPNEAVRNALESTGSERMMRGMAIGLHNSRGAGFRSAGGHDEQVLAEKYRGYARQIQASHPVTARMLEEVAEMYADRAEWHETEDAVRQKIRRR